MKVNTDSEPSPNKRKNRDVHLKDLVDIILILEELFNQVWCFAQFSDRRLGSHQPLCDGLCHHKTMEYFSKNEYGRVSLHLVSCTPL